MCSTRRRMRVDGGGPAPAGGSRPGTARIHARDAGEPVPAPHEGHRRRLTMPGWLSRASRLERKAAHAFRLGNYRAAIRHLDELLPHVGENPNTLHVLGLCHERLGGAGDKAFEYARRSLAVDEDHFEALRLLIRLHVRRGETGAARALVVHALARLPPPAEPPRGLGRLMRALTREGDPSLAGYDRELREWIDRKSVV